MKKFLEKSKRNIWIISLMILMFPCLSCSEKIKNSFTFSKGTFLRENYPEGKQVEYPILTISNGKKTKKLAFPLGTEIWKDKAESGCLILKYMDKRFAAFGSDAYVFIDLKELEIFTIVTDVIHEIKANDDSFLIGIQRIPSNTDYLEDSKDGDYNDSSQILFIIKFDYSKRRCYRMNVLTGTSLPDSNQIFTEDQEDNLNNNFFVKNGILHYKKNNVARKFNLQDFHERTKKYKLIE